MSAASERPLHAELAGALADLRRVRVPVDVVVRLAIELRPHLVASPDRYRIVADALAVLVESGDVQPARTTVRRGDVTVPSSVVVASSRRAPAPPNPVLGHPWVPSMRWAASLDRPEEGLFRRLVCLNAWCAANADRETAPERERSLEVFGDDKTLGQMRAGVLAAPGRLPAELRIEIVHPPMAVERIDGAAGHDLLIVENGTTFHSVVRAARRHVAGGLAARIGWVGYGSGSQLGAIVPSAALLRPAPGALWYFGDLDPPGLTFPAAALTSCEHQGLPPLRPHLMLYHQLLDTGRPQRRRTKGRGEPWPAGGLDWLGAELARRVIDILGDTMWLAQEWVGIDALSASADWLTRPSSR